MVKYKYKHLKSLNMFEKEKGGVGATGSLAVAAHVVAMRGTPVEFIEASVSQLDILNAYGGHYPVHQVDLKQGDASDRIIDIVDRAPEDAVIFANIPGGRFEELDEVHQIVRFALEECALQVDVNIVWTMGLDKASRVTLDALLEGDPPGRMLLNMPTWHGPVEKFVEVDDALIERIKAAGGLIYRTPALPEHLYNLFRSREIALDQIATTPGVSFGNRAAFGLWQRDARDVLEEIF